MLQLAIEIEV